MIYFMGYLVVGMVVLIVVLVLHRISVKAGTDSQSALSAAMCPGRVSRWDKLLHELVAPLLGGLFVIVAWPVAIYWKVADTWTQKAIPHEKVFAVTRSDLLRQMTVQEIEERERVNDPLGAVPNLPFGLLNAAWLRFKGNLEPADPIWAFSVEWAGNWERREIRAGYVAVRGTGFGPHFLTEWRRLDED